MKDYKKLLEKAYDGFNARDIDAVLSLMNENVQWPNGWEGGDVQGQEEVRAYWTRQWKEINPSVTPVGFSEISPTQLAVQVHQIVKDYEDHLLSEGLVTHLYTFENGKVQRMQITN